MTDDTTPSGTRPFCAIDAHGQVVMRGHTLELPLVPGLTSLDESAPLNTYRSGSTWLPIPEQPSPQHVFDWPTKVWADPRTLDQVRTAKLVEINQRFSQESAALIAGYPLEERQTWAAQEAEALAWALESSAPTPYLDGIAAARGIDVAEMRAKTLEAVSAFRVASQWLVGTRQALRDAIQNPNATRAQIDAVAWPTPEE